MSFEYDIFVPTVDNAGRGLSEEKSASFRQRIIDYFGGLTDSRHKNDGFWKIGSATVRDEIVIWRVISDKGPEGDIFLKGIKSELEKVLEQDEILIVKRTIAFL